MISSTCETKQPSNSDCKRAESSPDNRRRHPRHPYRTVTTVVTIPATDGSGKFHTIKAWTHDISAGGARLIANEIIEAESIFLRMLLPGSGDFYIAAEVTHVSKMIPEGLNLRQEEHYSYGVKFTGLVRDEDIVRELGNAVAVSSMNISD